jgi:hypothetical protein
MRRASHSKRYCAGTGSREEGMVKEVEWLTLVQLVSCQNSSHTWQVTAIDRASQTPVCRRFETEAVAIVFAQALAHTHHLIILEQVGA